MSKMFVAVLLVLVNKVIRVLTPVVEAYDYNDVYCPYCKAEWWTKADRVTRWIRHRRFCRIPLTEIAWHWAVNYRYRLSGQPFLQSVPGSPVEAHDCQCPVCQPDRFQFRLGAQACVEPQCPCSY